MYRLSAELSAVFDEKDTRRMKFVYTVFETLFAKLCTWVVISSLSLWNWLQCSLTFNISTAVVGNSILKRYN